MDKNLSHTVKTVTEISAQRLDEVLDSAWAGGCNYFVERLERITTTLDRALPWLGDHKGSGLCYRVMVGDDPETYQLDWKTLGEGLNVMARDFPKHFQDLVDENDDANTADILVQCSLFGKMIYG